MNRYRSAIALFVLGLLFLMLQQLVPDGSTLSLVLDPTLWPFQSEAVRDWFGRLFPQVNDRIFWTVTLGFVGTLFWPTLIAALIVIRGRSINFLLGFLGICIATVPLSLRSWPAPEVLTIHLIAFATLAVIFAATTLLRFALLRPPTSLEGKRRR